MIRIIDFSPNRSEQPSVEVGVFAKPTAVTGMYVVDHEDCEGRPTSNHGRAVGYGRSVIVKSGIALAFGIILQGCISTYVPAPDETMGIVRSVGFGIPQICKNGKFYWLPSVPGMPDAVSIPVDEQVAIGVYLKAEDANFIVSCRPYLIFSPQAGQTYLINAGMENGKNCFLELVREDPTSKTGLAPEPSVTEGRCAGR